MDIPFFSSIYFAGICAYGIPVRTGLRRTLVLLVSMAAEIGKAGGNNRNKAKQ